MKLLKDETIKKVEGDVAVSIKPVSTSQQAHIMALASKAGIEGKVALTTYALKNLIEKVTINDVDYEPSALADRADLSDTDTITAMVKIGGLVVSAAFPTGEDEKK